MIFLSAAERGSSFSNRSVPTPPTAPRGAAPMPTPMMSKVRYVPAELRGALCSIILDPDVSLGTCNLSIMLPFHCSKHLGGEMAPKLV